MGGKKPAADDVPMPQLRRLIVPAVAAGRTASAADDKRSALAVRGRSSSVTRGIGRVPKDGPPLPSKPSAPEATPSSPLALALLACLGVVPAPPPPPEVPLVQTLLTPVETQTEPSNWEQETAPVRVRGTDAATQLSGPELFDVPGECARKAAVAVDAALAVALAEVRSEAIAAAHARPPTPPPPRSPTPPPVPDREAERAAAYAARVAAVPDAPSLDAVHAHITAQRARLLRFARSRHIYGHLAPTVEDRISRKTAVNTTIRSILANIVQRVVSETA